MTARTTTKGGDARRGVLEPGVRPSDGRPATPCGTERGYAAHQRHHEPPCPACRDAHRRYHRYLRALTATPHYGRVVLRNPSAATLDQAIAAHPTSVIVAVFDQEQP